MGIEPTSPGLNPGVLSQLNYGSDQMDKWTSIRTEALRKRESNPDRQNFRRRLLR